MGYPTLMNMISDYLVEFLLRYVLQVLTLFSHSICTRHGAA